MRAMTEAAFVKVPSDGCRLEGGIHVWGFPADSSSGSLLSQDEVLRAANFQALDARAAFVAGRSGLRRAASLYPGIPVTELLIETAPDGKPHFSNAEIHFNLSHTDSTVAAVFSESPVGIDIESRGRCRDFVGIARRFFHPSEAVAISKSRDEEQFLRLWTAKEAMLKLSGEGISRGLPDARPDEEGGGSLRGDQVHTVGFYFGNIIGTVASFQPFEVKGWFRF